MLYNQAMAPRKITQVSRADEAVPIVEIRRKDTGDPVALSNVAQHKLDHQCAIGKGEHEDPSRAEYSADLGNHGIGIFDMLEHL